MNWLIEAVQTGASVGFIVYVVANLWINRRR